MVNKSICFVLLLLCCAVGNTLAQDKPQFVIRVEQVFKEKEPTWKVENQTAQNWVNSFQQDFTFKSGKTQAAVSIRVYQKERDAREVFIGETIAYDNISHKRTIKKRLPNLGDENYIWLTLGGDAYPTIRFRQGSVLVMVFAPSTAIAKRFAQYVANEIPITKKF